ncbi:MAG: hypothetical protein QX196_07610 [Methylococcaceae bacterium]
MTDREEFEKFLKDNFLYDTSGFIQNEAERKKAQDESFVWRAWQARGELDAVRIKEWQSLSDDEIGRLAVFDGLHHVEIPLLAKFILAIEQALKEKNNE